MSFAVTSSFTARVALAALVFSASVGCHDSVSGAPAPSSSSSAQSASSATSPAKSASVTELAPTTAPHKTPGPATDQMPLGTPPPTEVVANSDGVSETVREYHPNGNLYVEFQQKPGSTGPKVRHGPIRAWHENGVQQLIGEYTDGKKSGHWRYWDDMGQLEREGGFDDDKREGDWSEFFPLGKRKSSGLFHVGWAEGPWKTWHQNGQLESEGEYINNKREGLWKFYLPDGSVDVDHTGNYKDNHKLR